MNDAGAITSMLVPNSRSCPKIHTVIGCVFWPNVSATMRSFHVQRNWKMASDAIAGSPRGRMSRRKMTISLAIPLVVFFAFQRYFVQGLLAGSVK